MKLAINNQKIAVTEREALVSGTVNVYTAEFSFDSAWDGYEPVAVFESSGPQGQVSRETVIADGKCTVPWEVLLPGSFLRIGVYGVSGGKRLPTIYAESQFVARGAEGGEEAAEPSPGVVEQLLAQTAEDRAAAESAARRAEAAAVRQPYPDAGTGTWWVWDAEAEAYRDSGISYASSGGGAVALDTTLTKAGQAADAKAVGDAMSALPNEYLKLSGGTMSGKIVFPSGDATIGIANNADVKILGYGGGYFRFGDTAYPMQMRGSGTNPIYNERNVLLSGDVYSKEEIDAVMGSYVSDIDTLIGGNG